MHGSRISSFVYAAKTAVLVLILIMASTTWTEASTSQARESTSSEIRVVNISDGSLFSKADDAEADSELVDITLQIAGTGLPDGTDLLLKVQGAVTVGGVDEPAIINEYVEMNQNYCTANLPLFPGENTISIYHLSIGESDTYSPSVLGQIKPSVVLNVVSSYQSVGDDLTSIITEEQYNQITADSRNNAACAEANRTELGLPDAPNGQWYYTYENFINGMRKVPQFGGEGDINTRKLELAAFFANVAQETGSGGAYGAGCAIQEGYGTARGSSAYGGVAPNNVGFCGRGPIQLSWKANYKAYGADMGVGDQYHNDPDILVKNPAIGLAGSMWFWDRRTPQWDGSLDPPLKPSPHEVMVSSWEPLSNDTAAGRTLDRNFGVVTNIINGGEECGPSARAATHAQNRVNYYRAIAKILGAVIPESQADADLNCANQRRFDFCPSSPAYQPCQ